MRVSSLPSDFPLPVTVAKNKRHEYLFLKVKAHSLFSSAKLNAAEKNMFLTGSCCPGEAFEFLNRF